MTARAIPATTAGATTDLSGPTTRSVNPVGRAFLGYTVAILAIFAAVLTGRHLGVEPDPGVVQHLGVVASTVFALAGLLAGHRALAGGDRRAGAIALVLLGPGAGWSWLAFVEAAPQAVRWADGVAVVANAVAVVLLVEGLRFAHWFGVFSGLGSLALGLTAIGVGPALPTAEGSVLALLAGVAAMTCLYGLLVDREIADHWSLLELVDSRRRIEGEMARAEELLHDLRNGLLSIEAAIGSFDDELAAPVQAEAARLRRLTLRGVRRPGPFDLVGPVRGLVGARRAAGLPIELRAPDSVTVWGEAPEILAIVDNLVDNAGRHGRGGSILVEIHAGAGGAGIAGAGGPTLSVTNVGSRPAGDPDQLFQRGFTTRADGQGLGLSRARMLAGLNAAELAVGPDRPDRTTFVVHLAGQDPTPRTDDGAHR